MKTLIFFFLVLYVVTNSFSQEIVATSGNANTSGNKSIDWTLGEAIIETSADNNAMLTQGFHQPVLTVTAIKETELPDMGITVFPNPASDRVTIKIESIIQDKLYFTLLNINGKVLQQEKIHSREFEVPFGEYSPSMYYLIMHDGEHEINSYKIIKTLK